MSFQKSFPGIHLRIFLADEDRLVFSPTFFKIQLELLHIVDNIVSSVQNFDRLEAKLEQFVSLGDAALPLKPEIPLHLIDDCRRRIFNLLEEQRIGPELRLQDFDEYMSLMNGIDADRIYEFMKLKTHSFDEYCDLINHYNDIEHEITMNVYAVISLSFYEFNRSSLIETLENLAKFMQRELLRKMVDDQQADIAKLQYEYEEISRQSLRVPSNTAELMASKAYVEKTQSGTIPAMKSRLNEV